MSKRRNPSPAWRVQASSNLSFCVIHNWLRLRMVVPNARCTVDILGKATIYFPRIACVRANAFVISSACKKWHHDVAEPRFGSAHKSKLKRHRELYCRLIQDQTLRWRGGGRYWSRTKTSLAGATVVLLGFKCRNKISVR